MFKLLWLDKRDLLDTQTPFRNDIVRFLMTSVSALPKLPLHGGRPRLRVYTILRLSPHGTLLLLSPECGCPL